MGDKKDIGSFFENKLKTGTRSPDKNLWDRINTSLDEIENRKKSTLPYWFMGFGISILIGIFLLTIPTDDAEKHSDILKKNNSTEIPISTLEKVNNENEVKVSIADSFVKLENTEEELTEISGIKEEPGKEEAQNPLEIVSKANMKKNSAKSSSIDETFTITEKYYYYNSKDDENWITTDKSKIDSLISAGNKVLDSIETTKKDSITD